MITPLVQPTIVVRFLRKRLKNGTWQQGIHSYHFGPTSALRSIARARLPRAWLEGKDRATLLVPSRSPATRAHLRARGVR